MELGESDPDIARCTPAAEDAAGAFEPTRAEDSGQYPSGTTVLIASRRQMIPVYNYLGAGISWLGGPVVEPKALLRRLRRHPPTVLLLDCDYLDQLGAECLRYLRQRRDVTHVLLLCDTADCALVEAVLKNGFHGFLPSAFPQEMLVKAIHAVTRGEVWLPRGLLVRSLSERLNGCAGKQPVPAESLVHASHCLTQRENQVVGLLRQGFTNKQIALEMGIQEDTVKKHLQNVYAKLGVHRRILVAMPWQHPSIPN